MSEMEEELDQLTAFVRASESTPSPGTADANAHGEEETATHHSVPALRALVSSTGSHDEHDSSSPLSGVTAQAVDDRRQRLSGPEPSLRPSLGAATAGPPAVMENTARNLSNAIKSDTALSSQLAPQEASPPSTTSRVFPPGDQMEPRPQTLQGGPPAPFKRD